MLIPHRHAPAVAMFACALTGLSVAEHAPLPAAHAALVDLTPTITPTTITSTSVTGVIYLGSGLSIGLFNNGTTAPAGFLITPAFSPTVAPFGSITGVAFLGATSTFTGTITTATFVPGGSAISIAPTGPQFAGFITSSGGIGWFTFSFPAGAGTSSITAAALETTSGSIVVGTVPEPGSLALAGLATLALGGATLRRMREEREELDETIKN